MQNEVWSVQPCMRLRIDSAGTGAWHVGEPPDARAQAAGVMLLPGLGAGGAPTDCLAAHLKLRLPDATELAFYGGSLEVGSFTLLDVGFDDDGRS